MDSSTQVKQAVVVALCAMSVKQLSRAVPDLGRLADEMRTAHAAGAHTATKPRTGTPGSAEAKIRQMTFGPGDTVGLLTENFRNKPMKPKCTIQDAQVLKNSISFLLGRDATLVVIGANGNVLERVSVDSPGSLLVPLSGAPVAQPVPGGLVLVPHGLNMQYLVEHHAPWELASLQVQVGTDAPLAVSAGDVVMVHPGEGSSVLSPFDEKLQMNTVLALDGNAELPVMFRATIFNGDTKVSSMELHCCDATLLHLTSGLCLFAGVDRKTEGNAANLNTTYNAILKYSDPLTRARRSAMIEAAAAHLPLQRAALAWKLFAAYDTDHSGYISLDEFCSLLQAYDSRISETDVQAAFAHQAPDGWMSFFLFCNWVTASFGDMDDAAFEQGVSELLAVDGLDTSPAGDRSMWGFKVNVRAKSLSDAGLDVLASLNPTQWEEFESLAVAGWSPNADRMLVRVVSDCATRDNWQAGNKIKLANLKPKPNEIASMTRAGDSEERTIARMVARLAVLRRLNEMINDAIMPAVDLSNLQSTMPGRLLSACRDLVFASTKRTLWNKVMRETETSSGETLTLSRARNEFGSPWRSRSGWYKVNVWTRLSCGC